MLTPKQKAFADYYIECGGGGEVSGGDMGTDERMEEWKLLKMYTMDGTMMEASKK